MKDLLRSLRHTAFTTGLLIWHHLFKVLALFTLIMSIFLTIAYYWVVFAPTSNYLKYHELSVADVEQGERAIATVCYEVNERHTATGDAVFYVEDEKGERVYDSQVDFDFTLAGGSPCEQEFIPTQNLEPGMYYLRLIRTIQVRTLVPYAEPVEKKADIATTEPFTVKEKTFSKAEMNALLDEINRRIDELNKQLKDMGQPQTIAPITPHRSVSTPNRPAPVVTDRTPAPKQPQPVIEPRPPVRPRPTTPTPPNPPQIPEQAQERPGLLKGVVGGVNDTVTGLLRGVEGIL